MIARLRRVASDSGLECGRYGTKHRARAQYGSMTMILDGESVGRILRVTALLHAQCALWISTILAIMGFNNVGIQLFRCPGSSTCLWMPAVARSRFGDRRCTHGLVQHHLAWSLARPLSESSPSLSQEMVHAFWRVSSQSWPSPHIIVPVAVSWSQTSVRIQSKRAVLHGHCHLVRGPP